MQYPAFRGITRLLGADVEHGNKFIYYETQINDNILKQVVEYKFPKSYEMNCLNSVFGFDLDIFDVEDSEYSEANAAGVFQLNNLYKCFNGGLNTEELAVESPKVPKFNREKVTLC